MPTAPPAPVIRSLPLWPDFSIRPLRGRPDHTLKLLRLSLALLASLLVQLAVLVIGAVCFFDISPRASIVIVAGSHDSEDLLLEDWETPDELPTVEFDLPVDDQSLFVMERPESVDVPLLALSGLDRFSAGKGRAMEAEQAADEQQETRKPAESSSATSADDEVTFFGITCEARSAVFVVDCSGSMITSYLAAAKAELLRSVGGMARDQQFFAAFFHEEMIAMSPETLVPAAPGAKSELATWVATVKKGRSTNALPALRLAASLRPEVIYLLSDGLFDPIPEALVRQLQKQGTKVQTVSFYSHQQGAERLRDIAHATGGRYRFVPHPEILAAAGGAK